MTKKGLYKLATKPHVFLRDYVDKKQRRFQYLIPQKKVQGEHQYTVVSAIYNVAPYLDDYFKSLVYQSLNFEQHIHLVLVDDGSPDNSAEIIKRWQKKYPNNITYLKKENGGQASARNLGMDAVKTEWVTFIDPDDFVDLHYFEEIDRFLVQNSEIEFSMLSCSLIFFYERSGKIRDTHPLKYKFHQGKQIVPINKMEGKIQLSASTALFKTALINASNINFNEKIRPSFEDAHFIGIYLMHVPLSSIGFLKEAKYFYRKRAESTSTLDTGWQISSAFDDVLRFGCLGLFNESLKTKGYVSKELQKTVLYHLIWQFKKIVNNPSTVAFLTDQQKETYRSLLKEIFLHIDVDTIDTFNLAGTWFYHKVALLGMYKETSHSYQILYIDAHDAGKNELKVRYFSYDASSFSFYLFSGKEMFPLHSKRRKHDFLGSLFVYEYITWVPLGEKGIFNAFIDNKLTHLALGGKHWNSGIDLSIIQKHFLKKSLDVTKLPLSIRAKRSLFQSKLYRKKFKDVWLFMDRESQADDNAEHLYRHVMNNHPDINIFYIIKKESPEWLRLEQDGFKLIDFASVEHEASLIHAKHMISSDAVKYITNYLPPQYYKDLLSYKFTFLQHGVTKDDLSAWLNTKTIDCFVTAAKREYDSIAGDDNKYKFTSKELCLTGFPRHDNLLKNNHTQTKSMMIMPTWREYLNEIEAENSDAFRDTPYGRAWISLLHSDFLRMMAEKKGYKLRFFPHPNIKKFLDAFDMPNYIEVLLEQTASIQTLFQNSDLLLTDYSSVAFEMAILKKETIYYQFDHHEIFSGSHTYEKGYFDYEEDTFGAICYSEKEVISELNKFLSHNGVVENRYLTRMESFFAYHDTDNCKRTFEAIEALYHPAQSRLMEESFLLKIAQEARDQKAWKAVEERYELLLDRDIAPKESNLILSEAKYCLGKIEEAKKFLEAYTHLYGSTEKGEKIAKKIKMTQELLETLSYEQQQLLINEREDFLTTLTYKNILQWFKEKEWEILSVATKLIDKRFIVKKDLSYFYYIALVTANKLEKVDEALVYAPLVKDY